jgi:nitrous oxide reductase accessory protein NosL
VVSTEITRIVQMLFKNHEGTKTQRHEEKSKKPLWFRYCDAFGIVEVGNVNSDA